MSRGAPRDLANRLSRALTSLPFLGIVVAICTWPSLPLTPGVGLDPSWAAGLYMAFEEGLVFGRDIVFTYGPLGFLSVPTLWVVDLGVIAFAYAVLLHIAACTLVLWAASRIFDRLLAVVIAILACSFLGPPLVVIALISSAAVATGKAGQRVERAFPIGVAMLAAFALLGKVNFGVEIFAIGAVAVAASPWPRSLRRIAEFGGAFVVSLVLFWLLAGQPLAALPDYLSLTSAVASGHSQTMPLADPGPPSQVFLALALVAGFGVASWLLNSGLECRQRVALTAMIALFGFFSFKEGFVRQDNGHIVLFTSAMVSAWFVLGWRESVRWPKVASLAAVLAIAINFQPTAIDPIARVETAWEQTTTVTDPGDREALVELGRAGIIGGAAIDPRMVSELREGTVHVAPYETSVAWALGLDWKPLPVFQDYLAYTTSLDQANADSARSATSPELILQRHEAAGIDNRYPGFNGPEAHLEVLCHYRPERLSGEWMLLRKGIDRCGSERPLSETTGRFGEPIRVPRGPEGSVVIARIKGAEVSGVEQIRSMLFRAKPRFIELIAEPGVGTPGFFRLVPGTAQDGLVMRVPRGSDYPPPFALAPNADAFVIGGPGMEGGLDVEFRTVPMRR